MSAEYVVHVSGLCASLFMMFHAAGRGRLFFAMGFLAVTLCWLGLMLFKLWSES